jgi:ribosome-associated protein
MGPLHPAQNNMSPMNDADEPPSKSERKRRSTSLQELGETLIKLPDSELAALELPETLREAILLARRITAHGGLYRQKQYIGKLMRKIDAEPIRAALDARHEQERRTALQFQRLEQWRHRILTEGAPAIAAFAREASGSVDTAALAELVERARAEHADNRPPTAARALFQALRAASGG